MRSTFKALRDDDNLVVLARHRLIEDADVYLDELLGIAEYLVPVHAIDAAVDPTGEEVDAIIDWADDDAETLRRAWMLAVHRCGAREVNRDTVELLATALHRTEERVTPDRPQPVRPPPAPRTRPRHTARSRQPVASTNSPALRRTD
jgi:hypothetical protein